MSLFTVEVKNTENEISKRMSNPVLFTFFASVVVFHWQFFIGLFTTESFIFENFKITKVEYLFNILFVYGPWWVAWVGPLLATWLFVYILPKRVLLPALRVLEEYESERSEIKLNGTLKVKKAEVRLEREESRILEIEARQAESEKKIKAADPTVEWSKEYEELKKKEGFSHFGVIYEILYENQGNTVGQQSYVSARPFLAYLNSIGVVEYKGESSYLIQLTEKGKFFMKKFLEGKI